MVGLKIPKVPIIKSWKFTPQVLILIIIGVIIILGVLIFFWSKKEPSLPQVSPPPKEETIIDRQLRELEELREKAGTKPLTEEEIKTQLEEIDEARGKTSPVSEKEAQKQLEELNKARQSQ